MGIVISYRGTLNDLDGIDGLIADVRLFCGAARWEFTEVAEQISGVAMMTADEFMDGGGRRKKKKAPASTPVEELPEEETTNLGSVTLRFDSKNPPILIEETWRGIIAHPPDTESLALTFDGKGRLCQYMAVPQKFVKGRLKEQTHYLCFPLFCKTTGATEQHIAICLLLKMLRGKYIKDLKVNDDTGYFKTGNLAKLEEGHAMMAGLIGAIKRDPEFLKSVLKAAGKGDLAEGAVLLPSEIRVQDRGASRKAKKAATIH